MSLAVPALIVGAAACVALGIYLERGRAQIVDRYGARDTDPRTARVRARARGTR